MVKQVQLNRRLFLSASLLGSVAFLSGCSESKPQFNSLDVSGATYARDWSLPDTEGKMRSLSEFAGKVIYVFFGFTHCPEVCPTTMFEMAQIRQSLGKDADKFQIIFVTVDPARDTPELLREYLGYFASDTVGLVGTESQLAEISKEFKIYYQKVAGVNDDDYTMDHSAGGYIYDTKGKLRLYSQYQADTDRLTADIKQLLTADR